MSALDLDALERLARACVAANEKVDAAPNAYTRWDAEEERRAPHEDLGLHGAEVLALITRLRAAEARTAWQPIETAPRDGTLVLAWHPHWGGPDAVRCSSRGQWTADWLPTCAPTHWMPLPAAPEAT